MTAVALQIAGPKHHHALWSIAEVDTLCQQLCPGGNGGKTIAMAVDRMKGITCLMYTTNGAMTETACVLNKRTGGEGTDLGVEELPDLAIQALKNFRKKNDGDLPKGILLYRVGVAESQSKHVKEETSELCAKVAQFYSDEGEASAPGIEICQANLSGAKLMNERNDNAKPGSLLDEDEDRSILLSHFSRRGSTAVPLCLVRVTPVDNRRNNEVWESIKRITQKNCSMYENYAGAIKLPALAHKAKIGAAKISAWWSRYETNGDHWDVAYARMRPFLDRPFFV